ncbi:hypothetical protein PZB75_25870 [Streptomyces sp. AM 4-1-1]|uniref:hypothetical protein n=1 Tax=Streptomyces sp. AM 4-1-1 TaxID=3028710 RepID=UPI0023B9E649|nr:hypothetical protein [Streptomyces sp. AM 4-1-1]WEH37756.1 hypothetical protein PZB75_25870 [Streptomyces sp. AM 4-1-1]
MPAMNVPEGAQESPHAPAPGASAECRECQELRLEEAIANDEGDLSTAVDYRVLLRRHQQTADCSERRPA